MLIGNVIFEKMNIMGRMYSRIFCWWYIGLVFILGVWFFDCSCSCVKNCDVVMSMIIVIVIVIMVVLIGLCVRVFLMLYFSGVILKREELLNCLERDLVKRLMLVWNIFFEFGFVLFNIEKRLKKIGIWISSGR